ncbi:hypothetical protein RYA05_13625 [Pseudomonas syringae pv. actinidiae]|nr:hypothetical protein [Pseudomonas syringae pv. actinidiae]
MITNTNTITAQWSGYITAIQPKHFQGIAVRHDDCNEKIFTFPLDAVSPKDVNRIKEGAFFTWTLADGHNDEIISALNLESACFTENDLKEAIAQVADFQKNIAWD